MLNLRKRCLILASILWDPLVHAQNPDLRTRTQDITTYAAYSQQKDCAQSCFIYGGGLCWTDVLGVSIGCAQNTCIQRSSSFQARNDCYCSPGYIQSAQELLAACVSSKCKVGDVSVDVSSATSIYSRYCSEKGYVAGAPAKISASPTGTGGVASTARSNGVPAATSDVGANTGNGTSSGSPSSRSLSIGEIIGIVVGGCAGLAFIALAMWVFWKLFKSCSGRNSSNQHQQPPIQQAPIYPKMPDQQPWYPSPGPASEVGPSDSVSMVGGMARPAPTLVSDMISQGRW